LEEQATFGLSEALTRVHENSGVRCRNLGRTDNRIRSPRWEASS